MTLLLRVMGVGVLALAFAGAAAAFNAASPTLDRLASEAAGKPVNVWCETDDAAWEGMVGYGTAGFTRLEAPVVYLSPDVCWTLHVAMQRGYRDAGNEPMAYALLTLLHESAHQRGITGEGDADCAALAAVGFYAIRYFGYHAKDRETRIVMRWRTFRHQGHRIRLRVPVRITVTVPDRDYTRLLENARIRHQAKPPEYQGDC